MKYKNFIKYFLVFIISASLSFFAFLLPGPHPFISAVFYPADFIDNHFFITQTLSRDGYYLEYLTLNIAITTSYYLLFNGVLYTIVFYLIENVLKRFKRS